MRMLGGSVGGSGRKGEGFAFQRGLHLGGIEAADAVLAQDARDFGLRKPGRAGR